MGDDRIVGHAGPGTCNPVLVDGGLFRGETKRPQSVLLVPVTAQFAEKTGGGALRCRSRIVEFVRKIARKFAQRRKLFRLLFHARYLAYAIEQHRDAALSHRWDR